MFCVDFRVLSVSANLLAAGHQVSGPPAAGVSGAWTCYAAMTFTTAPSDSWAWDASARRSRAGPAEDERLLQPAVPGGDQRGPGRERRPSLENPAFLERPMSCSPGCTSTPRRRSPADGGTAGVGTVDEERRRCEPIQFALWMNAHINHDLPSRSSRHVGSSGWHLTTAPRSRRLREGQRILGQVEPQVAKWFKTAWSLTSRTSPRRRSTTQWRCSRSSQPASRLAKRPAIWTC